MRFSAWPGVLLSGVTCVVSTMSLHAQGGVAVPIVGSPAAQSPAPAPNVTPIQTPSQPAAMPAGPAAAQPAPRTERKLELSFDKGAVTLSAQNVTVREILAEWQRRSGCQFVNAEKLMGAPLTTPLEFSAKPELEVIESLLRGVAGYMVGPRSDSAQSGSLCGVVYILPTSIATSSVSSFLPSSSSPVAAPLIQPGMPDDEIPPVAVPINGPQQVPAKPGQPNPSTGQPNPSGQQPGQSTPGGFGPVTVMPIAPGVGRTGGAGTPPSTPTGGRGGA